MSEHIVKEQTIKQKYPHYFEKYRAQMCVGDGWKPFVQEIIDVVDSHKIWAFHFVQIKEKFGNLRVAYRCEDVYVPGDWLQNEINNIVAKANNSCEQCGKFGYPSERGWIKTLCPYHHMLKDKEHDKNYPK